MGMQPRFLTDQEVERSVDMAKACAYVERAFAEHALGRVQMPRRVRLQLPQGDLLVMPCYIEAMNVACCKLVSVHPQNPSRGLRSVQALIVALNPETGEPLLIAEASVLTAMRTGAASAVACRYLARREAEAVAIIGCGFQARYQIRALASLLGIKEVRAFCRTPSSAQAFADLMARELGLRAKATASAREAVEAADIVITATTSSEPVLFRPWLAGGAHICAIGSYRPDARELDAATIEQAKVVVDSYEAAREEAGDIILAVKEGRFSWERVHAELGELVIGKKRGRESEDEITVFKSVGLALQDAAMARLLMDEIGV
jgi:alanine dehydrogenase